MLSFFIFFCSIWYWGLDLFLKGITIGFIRWLCHTIFLKALHFSWENDEIYSKKKKLNKAASNLQNYCERLLFDNLFLWYHILKNDFDSLIRCSLTQLTSNCYNSTWRCNFSSPPSIGLFFIKVFSCVIVWKWTFDMHQLVKDIN